MFAFTSQAQLFLGPFVTPRVQSFAKAHGVIHWDQAGSEYLGNNVGIQEDITVTTDSVGKFSLDLPQGLYDVFVTTRFRSESEPAGARGR